jgi:hypothetical protein
MLALCPRCGKEIFYITAPGVEGEIHVVEIKEQRLINKMGRILVGYPEHVCTPKPTNERF